MRLIKTLPGLLLCHLLLACNLGAAPSPRLEVTYICFGTHNGIYSQAGGVTFHSDGTLNFNGYEGTWEYDAGTHELTFEGNRYLATGTYWPEEDVLVLNLKPDEPLSHAETGEIRCDVYEE